MASQHSELAKRWCCAKNKKGQNDVFQTVLPQYGENVKLDTASEHRFEKWFFAGDAHIVIEGV